MPATALIWAKDDRDIYQGYRKGAFVVVKDEPAVWGSMEGLPDFIRVTVSDRSAADVEQYLQRWDQLIEWEVTAHNVALDRYDVRLFATNRRPSDGRGSITRAQAEEWLAGWNITVSNGQPGELNCRFRISQIASSPQFLGAAPAQLAQVTLSEVSYIQATGEHIGRVVYPSGWPGLVVEHRISERAEVIEHDLVAGRIDFRVFRLDVLQFLRDEARDQLDQILGKRRWYLDPAAVDQVIGLGGIVTRTAAEIVPFMRDALAE